jgi:molybdenum cofactor guanylyltransferase
MQAAGFVLVGGRSLRMGCDKALLEWNAHPLVEEVAGKVRSVAGNVALVGPLERYGALGFDCVADLRPGLGPLAGIEAALASGRAEANLIVACDLPGIESVWLERLMREAEESGAKCVLIRDGDGVVQPLCGVYKSTCLPMIGRALDERRLRMQDLIEELQAGMVEIEEALANINTPEDWHAWRRGRAAMTTSHAG